jgi:hypothetical protein
MPTVDLDRYLARTLDDVFGLAVPADATFIAIDGGSGSSGG